MWNQVMGVYASVVPIGNVCETGEEVVPVGLETQREALKRVSPMAR